jgi:hypothetical protein
MRFLLPVVSLVAAGAVGGLGAASARWRRASREMAGALAPRAPEVAVHQEDFNGLPPPVERYLRRALPIASAPSAVRLEHRGYFLLNGSWRPFRSTELFGVDPRGFAWDARIRALPFIDVHVRDSSIRGSGSMRAAIAGMVPIVNEHGSALLDVGALQRYLAEAPWLPVALLPRFGVTWEALDESRARATIAEGAASVSLDFTFDDAGDVARVYSPARPREVKGHYEPTAWAGRSWEYQNRCGMRIPLESEVEWIVDGVSQPYFRGRIIDVECGITGHER